jgi:hypothetical protein
MAAGNFHGFEAVATPRLFEPAMLILRAFWRLVSTLQGVPPHQTY